MSNKKIGYVELEEMQERMDELRAQELKHCRCTKICKMYAASCSRATRIRSPVDEAAAVWLKAAVAMHCNGGRLKRELAHSQSGTQQHFLSDAWL